MSEIGFNTKTQLVSALEAVRPYWKKVDEQALRKHRAERHLEVKKFRKQARKYAKMNLVQIQEEAEKPTESYRSGIHFSLSGDRCPTSHEAKIDRAISHLNISNQERFRVSSAGQWSTVHFLLTKPVDDEIEDNLCEKGA
jgi:hypothetical protein